jgi:tripartite-type tricarboxylate transporter receptor subunit TctC
MGKGWFPASAGTSGRRNIRFLHTLSRGASRGRHEISLLGSGEYRSGPRATMKSGLSNRGAKRLCVRLVVGLVVAATAVCSVSAQEPAFFKGKTIRILLSAGVAGGYAEYARVLAQHLGDHLAGRPDFIVQSMPGAGGLLATNYLYSQAAQDGTTIGIIHSTVPLAPLFGTTGARFDALKFNWLGSLDRADGMCTAWHASPIKTWADMLEKEFVVGSTGAGSQFSILPAMLNKLLGTRIKVINGYKDGGEIFQAMEKGEIEGRCSTQLTAIQSIRPQWLAEHKLAVPILIGRQRIAEFPDTPAVMEFVKDAATRAQLELMLLTQDMDRPVLLPPGVPADRVAQVREALLATMADPAFVADAHRMHLHLEPVRGEDLAKALAAAYALPPDVVAAAKETMGEK